MKNEPRWLFLSPVIFILLQLYIFIDAIQFRAKILPVLPDNQKLSVETLFWQYTSNPDLGIHPTVFTFVYWVFVPIVIALVFGFTNNMKTEIDDVTIFKREYKQSLVIQAGLIILFLEIGSIGYAILIKQFIDKSFLEAFLALNLYLIIPLLIIAYALTESIHPSILIPVKDSRMISGFLILMLYFVYAITMSIGVKA